jgi:hypothetical protein
VDSFFRMEIHFQCWVVAKGVHPPFGENDLLVVVQKHTSLPGGVPSAAVLGSLQLRKPLLLEERDLQAYSWELEAGQTQYSWQRGVVRSHQQ